MIVSHYFINECLLGWHALTALSVISKSFPNDINAVTPLDVTEDSLEAIKSDFSDILGDTLGEACGAMKG